MIDFACKTIDVADVLRCSFELTRSDLEVFKTLIGRKDWMTSATIERETKLDRSTVQRSLKRLSDKALCERRQENHTEGGYSFHYRAIASDALARHVLVTLDGFRERLKQTLTHDGWTTTGSKKRLRT